MGSLRGAPPLILGTLIVATAAAVAVALGAAISPMMGLAAGLGVALALPAALFGVEWGLPVFAFLLIALEEFPSGLAELGEEGVERSTRTMFYAKSVGLSGLYPSDAFLLGILGLLVMNAILLRRRRFVAMDGVGVAIIIMIAMVILSAVLSLAAGNPFAGAVPMDDTTVLYHFNDRALRLIGLFQIKTFVLLLPAYVCGLLYLDRPDRLTKLLTGVLAGFLALASEGVARLGLHPGLLSRGSPLFYDSPSSWFFALFGFYLVSAWARRVVTGPRAAALGLFSAVLMLFVLISFRRTMWGGIVISALGVLAVMPGPARLRLILVGGGGAILCGVLLLVSPVGSLVVTKVGERINETGVKDLSTLYRLAMFVHFFNGSDDTPLFGWGVAPLWNKLVQFGYLTFNLENMHSLYFWVWLRTGIVGLGVSVAVYLSLLGRACQLAVTSNSPRTQTLAIVLAAMIFMFLFSGVFNPVYGEFRYIVPLGLGLAMLTRLPQLDRLVQPTRC